MRRWSCRYCGQQLEISGTHAQIRIAIETHLAAHAPLHACLGERSDGCVHRTNAFESSSPGYCIDCDGDPRWVPVT